LKKREPIIRIGNGTIIRDFSDVLDIVAAYDALLEKGKPGEIYNVCSGKGYSIHDVVEIISKLFGIKVKIEQDDDLLRPLENPTIIGSYEKIEKNVGWYPQINFEESLKRIYNYWLDKMTMDGKK